MSYKVNSDNYFVHNYIFYVFFLSSFRVNSTSLPSFIVKSIRYELTEEVTGFRVINI
jgi:hypothetical protein